MKKFEDPIQFEINKKVNNIEIRYFNLMEISQGGPEVGNITLNGKQLAGRFGGPLQIKGVYIYIPEYIKKFFGAGFKLARINSETNKVKYLSNTKDLIFLEKIEGNKIYFFEDLNKTVLGCLEF